MRDVRHVKSVFMMPVSIYVIEALGLIKVGTSIDPQRRARDICGELIHCVSVPTDGASRVESYAHAALTEWSRSKEWFSCDRDQAVRAVDDAVERLRVGLSLATAPGQTSRERQKRGLIAHAQRRADVTSEKLKIAIELWSDPHLSVREISDRSGLSRRTLYEHLPPRVDAREMAKLSTRTLYAHLPLRSEARDEAKKGKKHA